MANHAKYSEELFAEIVERLSKGEPLMSICRDKGFHRSQVTRWRKLHPEFDEAFLEARDDGFDAIAANCLEIADDSRNDYIEALANEDDPKAGIALSNGENIQRSKLRIETRLKLLAKWDPRRYGERLGVEHSGTMTLEQLVAGTAKPKNG